MTSEYDDLLDEAMGAFDEDADPTGLDVAQADRYGWALRAVERKRVALFESYNERRVMLDEVYNAQAKTLDAQTDRLETTLKQWLLAWNAGDDAKKSHTLPCGVKVTSTAGGIDLIVDDKEAFDAWVLKNMTANVTTETVTKIANGDVKKAIVADNTIETKHDGRKLKADGVAMTEDGAKIPGITLVKKPRNPKVTL